MSLGKTFYMVTMHVSKGTVDVYKQNEGASFGDGEKTGIYMYMYIDCFFLAYKSYILHTKKRP